MTASTSTAHRSADPDPRTTFGFTGHEEDDASLINMRGRIYDRDQYRFLSPDPVIAAPLFGQSYNPYSYVLNNPLRFTDPTGSRSRRSTATRLTPSMDHSRSTARSTRVRPRPEDPTEVQAEPPTQTDDSGLAGLDGGTDSVQWTVPVEDPAWGPYPDTFAPGEIFFDSFLSSQQFYENLNLDPWPEWAKELLLLGAELGITILIPETAIGFSLYGMATADTPLEFGLSAVGAVPIVRIAKRGGKVIGALGKVGNSGKKLRGTNRIPGGPGRVTDSGNIQDAGAEEGMEGRQARSERRPHVPHKRAQLRGRGVRGSRRDRSSHLGRQSRTVVDQSRIRSEGHPAEGARQLQ